MELAKLVLVLALVSCSNGFRGSATWFYTGLGHCGRYNQNSDHIVALSSAEYGGGVRCGSYIRITYKGKSVNAQVVDSCPTCARYNLDLSTSVFQALAPLERGLITVNWNYL